MLKFGLDMANPDPTHNFESRSRSSDSDVPDNDPEPPKFSLLTGDDRTRNPRQMCEHTLGALSPVSGAAPRCLARAMRGLAKLPARRAPTAMPNAMWLRR